MKGKRDSALLSLLYLSPSSLSSRVPTLVTQWFSLINLLSYQCTEPSLVTSLSVYGQNKTARTLNMHRSEFGPRGKRLFKEKKDAWVGRGYWSRLVSPRLDWLLVGFVASPFEGKQIFFLCFLVLVGYCYLVC